MLSESNLHINTNNIIPMDIPIGIQSVSTFPIGGMVGGGGFGVVCCTSNIKNVPAFIVIEKSCLTIIRAISPSS